MGIVKLNQREDYWRDNLISQSFIFQKMTLDRFNSILLYLHYVDMTGISKEEEKERNQDDPFWKVDQFTKDIEIKCKMFYQLPQFMSIDEMCILFTGRHLARQYNPSKPSPYHLKIFCLNDSKTGYLYSFYPYRGTREKIPNNISASNYPAYILTEDNELHGHNHVLITDNWFTSEESLKLMKERDIYQIGTMRANKLGDAKEFAFKKGERNLKRGMVKYSSNEDNDIYFASWYDKKPVNCFSAIKSDMCRIFRTAKNGHSEEVICPTVIELYNQHMGGTDLCDQMLQYYFPQTRSIKWCFRYISHFFYVCVRNSHILFKQTLKLDRNGKGYDLLSYIKMLMMDLVTIDNMPIPQQPITHNIIRRNMDNIYNDPNRTTGIHTPVLIDYIDNSNGESTRIDKRRKCMECNDSKRSGIMCLECNIALHLSPDKETNCWYNFHSKIVDNNDD